MTISSDGTQPGGQRGTDTPAPPPLGPPPALGVDMRSAVFLDFDGTLVDIAEHPDDVIVPARLPELITALSEALDGRLAVVTGRSIAALEALLGPLQVAVAGSHGGEFRPSAHAPVQPLAEPLPDAIVAELRHFSETNGGLLVEPKPFSVAVHYRRHPEALEGLLTCAESLASTFGLGMKHGKQVIELAMPGSDKGSAVARFMGLPAFAGATPLFFGDDVTDEDAFHAVRDFDGHGVLVGPLRPTAASYRLPDVTAVHAWLEAGLDAALQSALQGETRA